MKKSFWLMIVLLLSLMVALAACGGNNEEGTENGGNDVNNEVNNNNDDANNNNNDNDAEDSDGEPQSGGSITAAMYSAPDHQFNPLFYSSAYDANILDIAFESLVKQDENLEFIPGLAHDWEFNDEFTELTYQLEEDVTWHDGEPMTAHDVVFTYTAIADPDYVAAGGVRTNYASTLAGYEEYVSGDADTLEGVEALDDYTVKFTFAEPNIKALADTSFFIVAEHILGDIPVAEMAEHSSAYNAEEVIGTGPFNLTEYQEGEQYILQAYEDYWQGTPYLDSVVWQVVDQAIMTGMLQNDEIHLLNRPGGVPAADREDVEAMDNVEILELQDLGYQYMAFKHNHGPNDSLTDKDSWVPNEKVQDVALRQAIAHAINREGFVDGLMYGAGQVMHATFPEASWAYNEDAPIKYDYNEDRANEILDEAGYEWDGDFRTNPDGEEFTLNLDYPTGNEIRERTAPIIQENLQAVGIQVNLNSPREASAHFDRIEENDTDMDLYLAGWSLASGDPDPSGYFLSTAAYNYPRYDDETFDQLMLEAITAPDAFDQEYREEKYNEWSEYMSEQLPVIPLYSQNVIYAHNANLQGITFKTHQILDDSHLWYLEQ
ncbi:ABC transporter substrate-binding protein [Salipaludibacillus daqingensis]|uniref:ABC transporter substrate-binding protein n=1 Tax=Salipaludibacillus daqingensis TaxID=3041001 RepID=UPI002473F477|nr:ABC transporter substrate-binding protein [Salipaludibacillus daqingensis]